MFHVGFTGSRNQPSEEQAFAFSQLLKLIISERDDDVVLHHGSCVGADAMSHEYARLLGVLVHIHPPENPSHRAELDGDVMYPPKGYLDRNKDIVDCSDVLIACPDSPEHLRSGTWSTVRYARKRFNRWIIVISPTGTIFEEN